jgi:hypothetical protein
VARRDRAQVLPASAIGRAEGSVATSRSART